MSSAEFLPRYKIKDVSTEFKSLWLEYAEKLGLYDPRFPESEQCSGFFAFKQLCLIENLMSPDDLDANGLLRAEVYPSIAPGWYLLTKIHARTRRAAIICALTVQKRLKLKE